MNYERKQQLIAEFKTAFHNKDFKPKYSELGHKIEGKLTFSIFIFYAMLRNKKIEKTTHDVESDKYKEQLMLFKAALPNYNGYMQSNIFSKIKTVFPSITEEEIVSVIQKYF